MFERLFATNPRDLETMNPMFLITDLENAHAMNLSNLDGSPRATVDDYINRRAVELGLPVIGLESFNQLYNIMYNPPYDVMLARIMLFLPLDEFVDSFNESLTPDDLGHYYQTNDFESINNYFASILGIDNDCLFTIYFREYIGNWRSTYYAHEIARLLQETEKPTTFFVAVGLSHINRSEAGDEFTDIVEQLKLLGFTVTVLW